MRIVIAGSGSQGDTRPYLALAAGLKERGHETVVCLDGSGAALADDLGVEFHELAGDFRRHLDGGRGTRALEKADGGFTGLMFFRTLAREHTESWLATITDVARAHRADVVIGSGLATFAAITAAELTGAQSAVASAFPLTPTTAFASPVSPRVPPRLLNRATHEIATRGLWSAFSGPTNRARRRRGLPSLTVRWSHQSALYGFSPALLDAPKDWSDAVRVCGEWHLAEPAFEPSAALVRFLDEAAAAGDPPVYVGFGSMAASGTAEFSATILRAVGDRRVVLAPGWSGIDQELGELPDSVHVVGQVPHGWLLPQCSVAFHHCGAGTTHAVARAGIPSVPVPFAADQPFWARRLHTVGIASAPLDRRRVETDQVRAALAAADAAPTRGRAADVAERMRADDPIAAVIEHLSTRG